MHGSRIAVRYALSRVYFGYDGPNLIILLAGGDKDSQSKDIKMAKEFWNDYKKTKK